eukprot:gnl/TRDRNA2_/TRDRNA2_132844_c0_seq1.p1 gnl/TRDRNA2_/TRDRNA2_132844_c0~~gnl/TRDRNA2_/TRDRNA2_132844_c0_seq1.p1  ORF type:complete len:259 (+),score=44.68 gnl/TRDRNA2_/TRDRNA2_132844_c0_seq1:56-832(+)
MGEPPLLIRVKRRRDDEPIPELVVDAPAKRHQADASAAALRLVDSVACGRWTPEEEGLPLSWLRAAAGAGPWGAPLPSSASRLSGAHAVPPSDWVSESRPILQEVQRRLLPTATSEHDQVQLIDVENIGKLGQQPSPYGYENASPATSVFTVDGMQMVATPVAQHAGGHPTSGQSAAHEECESGADEYVWDIYAPSDCSALTSSEAGHKPHLSAFVRLATPLFAGSALEDLEDIDDSQSSAGESAMDDRWGVSSGDEA